MFHCEKINEIEYSDRPKVTVSDSLDSDVSKVSKI